MALLRAFFKMGVPVNGKTSSPPASGAHGYHIRVSHEGYVARRHTSGDY